ncbi:prolyl 4-hydroxylase subunit alpha-2-like [Hyposmocoma kahamanoa]|uniref:prolyl 4-hydroxylase subunit alpha-2-like n=1 Tax=Hyposmocoma kahamanoa TaxID=1477025 RepID=UPI000E6D7A99|nr:prolyl 4-hydroxylase subunit alpha-2-like [Hyposmocoma kahamanoa]
MNDIVTPYFFLPIGFCAYTFRYLNIFTNEHEKANRNAQKYVENPINAFTLIKRLSTDFEVLKTVASDITEFVWDRELLYPTEEDLIGAAVAIGRLQYYYKLNTTELAEGNLKGVFGSPMSGSDCYSLALMLYKQEGPYNYSSYAAKWFEAARERLDETPFSAPNMITYMDNIEDLNNTENHYYELCRGEINISSVNTSKLQCVYLKRSPFLMLAPIKMEMLLMNPVVVLFHDVLANSEIEIMKMIAGTKLDRAFVISDGEKKASGYRTAQCAWLDEYNDTIEKVKQRAADFTGLSSEHAEPLEVLNYGIGGHYDLHYDDPPLNYGLGIRIATVLFYMSDVSQGGATVFPKFKLAVRPKKGAALYWMNLHPTGEVDVRTLHASCPVLHGSKWVANMRIHGAGQELLWPCPLAVD